MSIQTKMIADMFNQLEETLSLLVDLFDKRDNYEDALLVRYHTVVSNTRRMLNDGTMLFQQHGNCGNPAVFPQNDVFIPERLSIHAQLANVFNDRGYDSRCDTPDHILADHVVSYLNNLEVLLNRRTNKG